ncbi:hypothetical protein DB346_05825 [Verrucomicrobia bacterium LW23]|nr:hypothetical protein DB346_05825 [Verrucomicrobia bacterium LW23]
MFPFSFTSRPALPSVAQAAAVAIAAVVSTQSFCLQTFGQSPSQPLTPSQVPPPGPPPSADVPSIPGNVPATSDSDAGPQDAPGGTPKAASVQGMVTRYQYGSDKRKATILLNLLYAGPEGIAAVRRIAETEEDPDVRRTVFAEFAGLLQTHVPRLINARRDDMVAAGLYLGATSWSEGPMRSYISYELWRGRLPQATEQVKATFGSQNREAAVLLSCMYRASGDMNSAILYARRAGDTELVGALLVETGDWNAEFERLKAQPTLGTNGLLEGRMALVAQQMGDPALVASSLASLRKCVTAGSCDPARAAAFLIQCDRVQEAVEFLTEREQAITAEIEMDRGNYAAAAAILNRMLASNATRQDQQSLNTIIDFTHKLGLHDRTAKAVAEINNIWNTPGGSLEYNTWMDVWTNKWASAEERVLTAMGYESALPATEPLRLLYPGQVYPGGQRRANNEPPVDGSQGYAAWWYVLRVNDSGKSLEETLRQMDEIFNGKVSEARLCELVERAAVDIAGATPENFVRTNLGLVRILCLAGKQGRALAAELIKRTAEAHPGRGEVMLECARLSLAMEMYPEAIAYFTQAPRDPVSLLMLAQCYTKTGKPELAKAAENQVLPLMWGMNRDVMDQQWAYLLGAIQNFHLPNYRQWLETAQKTSMPGTPLAAHFIRYRLAFALAEEGRFNDALKMWHGSVLSAGGVREDKVPNLTWLRAQYHALRARALLAESKFPEAIAAIKLSMTHRPYTPIGIDMVRTLEKAGRKAEADAVFEMYYQNRLRASNEYPDSSSFANDLAWLCANTHRNLDEALARAEKATTLSTRRPELIDTLAEVHFQRGNNKKALELLRQCTWMQPGFLYFQQQVQRVQEDKKSTPPPEDSWMSEVNRGILPEREEADQD